MVKKFKKIIPALTIMLLPVTVKAQAVEVQNPLKGVADNIPELITLIINILLSLVGLLAVVSIIIAGYQLIFSGGTPDKIKSAKNRLLWSIIGLVVVILAYSIVNIIVRTVTSAG